MIVRLLVVLIAIGGARPHDFDRDHARSRNASALRLVILVVVTALIVAFIMAGMFAELVHQLAKASR